MTLINNIEIIENKITFDLNNNTDNPIEKSLANAIRRILISEISVYAIDKSSIIFYDSYNDNNIFFDEFLKDRLGLIPIVSNLDINYDNIVISCKKENKEENIINVYVKDFVCTDTTNNEIINDLFKKEYLDILFSKLKIGSEISFECKLNKNNAVHGGSAYSAVAACAYKFKIDSNKVNEITSNMSEKDKTEFLNQENERYYSKNKNGEPLIYQFSYEAINNDPISTLLDALLILINKLNILKIEFTNNDSDKISYIIDEDKDFFKFQVEDENDTIGNLLSTYISNDDNIFYSGYLIEHPLKKNVIFKFKLKNDNTYDNIIKVIISNIDNIINILNICISDIKK
jgi:DNA-directed RNA polymerase subunit L